MNPRLHIIALLLAAACLPGTATTAVAADTLETWDAGSGNIDFYLSLDGMGRSLPEQGVAGEMLLGWGVADRLSTYLAVSLAADGALADGDAGLGVGLFGTPVDTDHLDLDLVLDLSAGGAGLRELSLGPALELNLDATPDQASWGAYVRAGLAITGRAAGDDGTAKMAAGSGRLVDRVLTVGAYRSLGPRRQLLLEYDLTWYDEPAAGTPAVDRGGLALGFNQMLGDSLELVTQGRWDVPQGGESGGVGFTVGFIAGLPGAGGSGPRDLP
jgi:hypothetical protein